MSPRHHRGRLQREAGRDTSATRSRTPASSTASTRSTGSSAACVAGELPHAAHRHLPRQGHGKDGGVGAELRRRATIARSALSSRFADRSPGELAATTSGLPARSWASVFLACGNELPNIVGRRFGDDAGYVADLYTAPPPGLIRPSRSVRRPSSSRASATSPRSRSMTTTCTGRRASRTAVHACPKSGCGDAPFHHRAARPSRPHRGLPEARVLDGARLVRSSLV